MAALHPDRCRTSQPGQSRYSRTIRIVKLALWLLRDAKLVIFLGQFVSYSAASLCHANPTPYAVGGSWDFLSPAKETAELGHPCVVAQCQH